MKSTREKWRGMKYYFYLLAHEHLYVFRRPAKNEEMSEFENGVRRRNLRMPGTIASRSRTTLI